MREEDLESILEFLRDSEKLKNTLRRAYTSTGRVESTAEHSWRLCLMVSLFEEHYRDIDMLRLLKLCLVHDLGEAISGDIAAVDQVARAGKGAKERNDLQLLIDPLPARLQSQILELWDDYENPSSKEAQLAKAFDKLETILQHSQGDNPPDFDYEFNLTYGKQCTDADELTSRLRALLDMETSKLASSRA